MTARIKSIKALSGFHTFQNYTADEDIEDIRRFNLIYGFNGCGKTTISRIFRSIELAELHHKLPPGCRFTIELENRTTIDQDSLQDNPIHSDIAVFNEDYVDECLHWSDASAKPIIYLGKEQSDLAKEIEEKHEQLKKATSIANALEAKLDSKESEFSLFKRELARRIGEAIGSPRNYNATSLSTDYNNLILNSKDKLNAKEIKSNKLTISNEEAPSSLQFMPPAKARADLISEASKLISMSVKKAAIDALTKHPTMTEWAHTGYIYHLGNKIENCLLCNNRLTDERLATLADAFDDSYRRILTDTEQLREAISDYNNQIQNYPNELHHKSEVHPSISLRYESDKIRICHVINDLAKSLQIIIDALSAKASNPSLTTPPVPLPSTSDFQSTLNELDTLSANIEQHIQDHNSTVEKFEETKQESASLLKRHYLFESQLEYQNHDSILKKQKQASSNAIAKAHELKSAIQELREKSREHNAAAEIVNQLIQRHLGHKELHIAPTDDGYELRRNGSIATTPPSEGEKTAIALSYFLVSLESEGRKKSNRIVILDDPISSLDTQALNFVSSMIESSLNDARQLIVLTHNLQFANNIKKWLRNRTRSGLSRRNEDPGKASASLFVIDSKQSQDSISRISSIIDMPPHLRDYESEYHYLYSLVLHFTNNTSSNYNYYYIMPNAIRKILETFLAFNSPKPDGIKSKLQRIAQAHKLDYTNLLSLEKLIQVESHGDNLDDLVTLAPMTVEELRKATSECISFMEQVSPTHTKEMNKICSKNNS